MAFFLRSNRSWTKSGVSFQAEPSEFGKPVTYAGVPVVSGPCWLPLPPVPAWQWEEAANQVLLCGDPTPESDFKPLGFKCQLPPKGNDDCFLSRCHPHPPVTRTRSSYYPVFANKTHCQSPPPSNPAEHHLHATPVFPLLSSTLKANTVISQVTKIQDKCQMITPAICSL